MGEILKLSFMKNCEVDEEACGNRLEKNVLFSVRDLMVEILRMAEEAQMWVTFGSNVDLAFFF